MWTLTLHFSALAILWGLVFLSELEEEDDWKQWNTYMCSVRWNPPQNISNRSVRWAQIPYRKKKCYVKWTELMMGRWSFYSASSFTLEDSHRRMHLPSSLHYFGLSSYAARVPHASEENDNYCRKRYAGHRQCSKNVYKHFIVGCFSSCTEQNRFLSNEVAAVGLLQVLVLSIFLWNAIDLSLMLGSFRWLVSLPLTATG